MAHTWAICSLRTPSLAAETGLARPIPLQRGRAVRGGKGSGDEDDDDPEDSRAYKGCASAAREVPEERTRIVCPREKERETPEREGRIEDGFDGGEVERTDVADARLERQDRGERDEKGGGAARCEEGDGGAHRGASVCQVGGWVRGRATSASALALWESRGTITSQMVGKHGIDVTHGNRCPWVAVLAPASLVGVALVCGCGSSGSPSPTYSFPDAGTVDARVDATRPQVDAARASDATPSSDGGTAEPCTADGGIATLSTRAYPFDYGILVDRTAVYYFGIEADAGQTDLRSVRTDGTGETELTMTSAQTLAEDGTSLYWGGYNPAFVTGIFRIAKVGGPAQLLAGISEVDPQSIVVAGASVYWTAGVHEDGALPEELLQAPLDGGTASTVVPATVGEGAQLCGADAQNLYWVEPPGHLYARRLTGGTPQALVPQLGVEAFDVDDGLIYFNANNGLYSVPTAGGTPRLLAESVGSARIAHTATDVYLEEMFEGRIVKVPKAGGSPKVVVSGSVVGSAAFAVDERCVYWVGPGNDGAVPVSLYKAPN